MECFDFTVGSAPTCIREFQTNVSNFVSCNLSNQLRPQAHQLRLTNKLPFIYLLTFTFLSFPFTTQRQNASLFFFYSFCLLHALLDLPSFCLRKSFSWTAAMRWAQSELFFAFFLSHFLGLCFYSFIFFFFASFQTWTGCLQGLVFWFASWALSSSPWSRAPTLRLFWMFRPRN